MKIFWLLLSVVLISVAIFLGYFGVFTPIKVELKEKDEIVFVKRTVKGDYSQTSLVQTELYNSLLSDSVTTKIGIGIFYDNPQEVKAQDLRSDVGCVISRSDLSRVHSLFKYEVATLNAGRYIVAEFPFKGQMSILFGILRVYPKLEAYAKVNKLNVDYAVEIYDVPNHKTVYMMRIK